MTAQNNTLIALGNEICDFHKSRLNFLARAFVHEFAHLQEKDAMNTARNKVRGLMMENHKNLFYWIDDNIPLEHLHIHNLQKIINAYHTHTATDNSMQQESASQDQLETQRSPRNGNIYQTLF